MQLSLADSKTDFWSYVFLSTASNCAWKIRLSQLVPSGPAIHTSQFWTKNLVICFFELSPCSFASSSQHHQSISTLFPDHICSHLCHREQCPPQIFPPDHIHFCEDTGHPPPWITAVITRRVMFCRAEQREWECTLSTWWFMFWVNTCKLACLRRKEWARNAALRVLLENGCLHTDILFCCHP